MLCLIIMLLNLGCVLLPSPATPVLTVIDGTIESKMKMPSPHMSADCLKVCAVRSTVLLVTQIDLLSFGRILTLRYKVICDPTCGYWESPAGVINCQEVEGVGKVGCVLRSSTISCSGTTSGGGSGCCQMISFVQLGGRNLSWFFLLFFQVLCPATNSRVE